MWGRFWRWMGRLTVDPDACPHCKAGADEDCRPGCVERKCPECFGLGVVADFNNVVGVSDDDGVLYGGKACPRGCEPNLRGT